MSETDPKPGKPPVVPQENSEDIPSVTNTSSPTSRTEETLTVLPAGKVPSEVKSDDKPEELPKTSRNQFRIQVGDTKALKEWLLDYNKALFNLKIIQTAGAKIMSPFLTENRKEKFTELLEEQTELGLKVGREVIQIFEMRTDKDIALKELTMLKQGNLPVAEYAERLRTLGDIAYDEEVPVDIRDAFLISRFIENSNDRFQKELMKTSIIPQSLDEMVFKMERFLIFEDLLAAKDEQGRREAYYQLKAHDRQKEPALQNLSIPRKVLSSSEWKTNYNKLYRSSYPVPSPTERSVRISANAQPYTVTSNQRSVPLNRYQPNELRHQRSCQPQFFGGSYHNKYRFQRNQRPMPVAREDRNGYQFQRFPPQHPSNRYSQQNNMFNRTYAVRKPMPIITPANAVRKPRWKATPANSQRNRKVPHTAQKQRLGTLLMAVAVMMMILITPVGAVQIQQTRSSEIVNANYTSPVFLSQLQQTESMSTTDSLPETGVNLTTNIALVCLGKIVQVIIRSVNKAYVNNNNVYLAKRLKHIQPNGIIECREAIREKGHIETDLIDVLTGEALIVKTLKTSRNHIAWQERSNWESSILPREIKIDYYNGLTNTSTLNKTLKCSYSPSQCTPIGLVTIQKITHWLKHHKPDVAIQHTDCYLVILKSWIAWIVPQKIIGTKGGLMSITIDNTIGNTTVLSEKLLIEHLIPNYIVRSKGHSKVERELLGSNTLTISTVSTSTREELEKFIEDKLQNNHALGNIFRYNIKRVVDPKIVGKTDTLRMTNNKMGAEAKLYQLKGIHLVSQQPKKETVVVSGIRHVVNRTIAKLNMTLKTRMLTASTPQLSKLSGKYPRSYLDFSCKPEIGNGKMLEMDFKGENSIPRNEVTKLLDNPVVLTNIDLWYQPLKTIIALTLKISITTIPVTSLRFKEFPLMIRPFTQIILVCNKSTLQTFVNPSTQTTTSPKFYHVGEHVD